MSETKKAQAVKRGKKPRPARALLLAPGAGSDRNNPLLIAMDNAVGLPCERMDFPYRQAGRRAPDRAPVLIASVREHAAQLVAHTKIDASDLVLGGRSMGGRMCSMAVAEGLPARALVLICYPLHPPGRPDKLRVEHFPNVRVPCLFVSGTSDAFGTPDEMLAHTAAIAGPVTHVWIEGADHSLARRDAVVSAAVADWMASLGLISSSSRRAVSG